MGMELASAIYRHLDRVRQNPALAVAPEELAELERLARQDSDGVRIALVAPQADRTDLSRVFLTSDNDDEVEDDFPNLAEPMTIVGLSASLIATEANKTAPPLEAIDVRISLGRDKKEIYTNAQNVGAQRTTPFVRQSQFVPITALDASIANRVMNFDMRDPPFAITFGYRWGVDKSVRDALTWSNVLVSLAWFVRLETAHSPGRGH
jgi:hypothetical protein